MSKSAVQHLWVLVLCLVVTFSASAQSLEQAKESALRYLQTNPASLNLSASDVADVRVSDAYRSQHNGITHVWLQQQYHGIPVFNALFGINVAADGKTYHLGHRFIAGLQQRVNTAIPSLSAYQVLERAMTELGFSGFAVPGLREKHNAQNWLFDGGAVSKSPIPVTAVYQPVSGGSVRLAWMLVIAQANSADVWNIRIDAQNGQVLDKLNRTVYCGAEAPPTGGSGVPVFDLGKTVTTQNPDVPNVALVPAQDASLPGLASASAQYRVYPLPTESPYHGAQVLVSDPAIPAASPFGWHDIDGASGAEYTYTRGNNVWAYSDATGDSQGSEAESAPGGANLVFDFVHDINNEPVANINAAVTNLFYINNMMHDVFYVYGFDEAAGNYQLNNYNHGGEEGDNVNAEAIDASGQNNANFSPSEDGVKGQMQMYVWTRPVQVTCNFPAEIADSYYATPANGWGGAITATGVTAEAVLVDDGSSIASQGCNPPINNLNGKIALIDRGTCQFGQKALNAQDAGAIGCIICNFEDASVNMGAGNFGAGVSIPVVMLPKTKCDLFKAHLAEGLNLTISMPVNNGPNFFDGDFDNGIITHEYGHGISTRLTGGPSNPDCLTNAEQMGEGWSDWVALVNTVKPGDTGDKIRGMGTYVYRQANNGGGIRRFPYSTDMSINPLTFGTVAENTEVHALGEIWAAVTWDLYWAMVDKYGFDADITNTNSGNGRAMQLVMDGMKLQPCKPGFLDGRNAIMLADILNYNGADTCLISQVFARRGMGINASQGSAEIASDGVENFEPIPTCIKELKIKKVTNTPTIDPGGLAAFQITVTNHKDAAVTNVTVTDPLPAGLQFEGASNGGSLIGNAVTWNLGTLAPGQVITVAYSAKSIHPTGSIRTFRDEMENDGLWFSYSSVGSIFFYPQEMLKKTGDFAWRADNVETETDFTAEYQSELIVSGARPTMRFWNRYNTEKGADAGFIEIQKKGEAQWRQLKKEDGLRNGYPSGVQYTTFAIPFLSGFSGSSNGWVQSYLDMSEYAGDTITFRFRFGSDTNTGGDSWIVDDVEILDLLNYDSEACVTSAEGDQACAKAPESGVIVNPGTYVGAAETLANRIGMTVQPNPVADVLFVSTGKSLSGDTRLTLVGTDGRIALTRNFGSVHAGQQLALEVQNVPAGVYALRLDNAEGSSVVKVVVQ